MFLETLKMPLHSQGVRCKFQPKGNKAYDDDTTKAMMIQMAMMEAYHI